MTTVTARGFLATATDTLERTAPRFVALLRSGVDPDARVSPEWTVQHAANHVAHYLPLYVDMVAGNGSPVAALEDLAVYNQRTAEAGGAPDLHELADQLEAGLRRLVEVFRAQELDRSVPWHGGGPMPLSSLAGLYVGELLVHGFDIAKACRRPWPIGREDAAVVVTALMPVLPLAVNEANARGFRAAYEVRLRGVADARWLLVFDDGRLEIAPAGDRKPDCVVSADPTAYLLVGYGRKSPTVAALTGSIASFGRKPWLGFRFGSLLNNP